MFVATINRTLKSYIFAIVGAEYILQWLPIGTHDWNKFVQPKELIKLGDKNKLDLIKVDGVNFDLLNSKWFISSDKKVNYISYFKKT